jgi:hypothetical protein
VDKPPNEESRLTEEPNEADQQEQMQPLTMVIARNETRALICRGGRIDEFEIDYR